MSDISKLTQAEHLPVNISKLNFVLNLMKNEDWAGQMQFVYILQNVKYPESSKDLNVMCDKDQNSMIKPKEA